MDAIEAIYGRRAVRDFAPGAPSRAEIISLIEAAIQAPSGMNRQPWAFVVLTGRDALASCSAKAKAHLLETMEEGPLLEGFREMLASPDFDIFYNAPVLIVICATVPDAMAVKDCSLAAENLMLAAHAHGFGTCWIGFSEAWLTSSAGKKALGIPENLTPIAPIILGRPAVTPARPERRAPDLRWAQLPAS